jgi:hypothetical protein
MPPRTRKPPTATPTGQPRAGASGLLAYGQAGVYNGVDDRQVITTLAGGRTGLMTRPQLTAVAGTLTMTLAAGWWAVADCMDGTSAVIGSRQSVTIPVSAGPASGSARTDYVWADVDPNGATWTISLITSAQTAGRAGILLGTLSVPVGAGTASLMTFTPQPARMPLARGVLAAVTFADPATDRRATSFSAGATIMATPLLALDTGRWYRARWRTPDAAVTNASGTMTAWNNWLGVSFVSSPTASGGWVALGPEHTFGMRMGLSLRSTLTAEYVFTGLAGQHRFAVRSWIGSGWGAGYGLDIDQRGMILTAEDLGPGPDPIPGGEAT